MKAPDGPLYIATRIAKYPSYGCLVHPNSIINIIIEELLFVKQIHRDFYFSTNTWMQTCKGFLYPPQGSISLSVEVCGKVVNSTLIVIPTFDQFQVKLGLPWLTSIQDIAFPFH